jgi:uncharacterized protein
MTEPLLVLVFAGIAFVYSLGGFAGGSSYLLAMTLSGSPHAEAKSVALFCNAAVSLVVFLHFVKAGHFRFRKTLPFAMASIPAAYWGAGLTVGREAFLVLLSVCLGAASLRLFLAKESATVSATPAEWVRFALPAGALIGLLSGAAGVGGGIFLYPVLVLKKWMTPREASASASFFIWLNSVSGLVSVLQKGIPVPEAAFALAAGAAVGGFLGSRRGARSTAPAPLARLTAATLALASLQLAWTAL